MYGYGMGEFGFTFFLMFIAYYLMYYMTDVLCLPSDMAATVYTLLQWFECITVVGAGIFVDRVKISNAGYRTWMMIGAIVCAICTVLFFIDFKLSAAGNVILFSIFYFIAYSAYNLMWIAYRSVAGSMAHNSKDNVSLTITSSQMGSLSGLIFSIAGVYLLGTFSDMRISYPFSATVYGVTMVICMAISVKSVRLYDKKTTTANSSYGWLKGGWNYIIRSISQPMIIFVLAVTMREMASTTLPTLMIYYFKYVMGNENLLSIYLTVTTLSTLLGYIFARNFANRFGKKQMFLISCYISTLCIMAVNIINGNIVLFMALMVVHSISSIFSGAMIPVFMNEIADYNEFTKGINSRGFVVSIGGLAVRCASILGGAVASFGLAKLDYSAGAGLAADFGEKLTLLMTVGSSAGILIGGFIMLFYKLDNETMDRIYISMGKK